MIPRVLVENAVPLPCNLREKQVAERRERILRTAESLIRKTGGTEFTMRSLAAAAEVSPVTPYNLFESKEGLLYSLLSRSLDARQQNWLCGAHDLERPASKRRNSVSRPRSQPFQFNDIHACPGR
jgi:AcrR family transcriptional regulator